MARLTDDDVLKLARLSRLKLSDDEIAQFKQEIGAILDYVAQLQEVVVDDLEPTSQVTGLNSVVREDEVIDYGATSQQLLKNAPAIEQGQIKVRKIL